ncbi:MAG: hypothetical protein AAF125_12210 [Chloroflexota bacterium]
MRGIQGGALWAAAERFTRPIAADGVESIVWSGMARTCPGDDPPPPGRSGNRDTVSGSGRTVRGSAS